MFYTRQIIKCLQMKHKGKTVIMSSAFSIFTTVYLLLNMKFLLNVGLRHVHSS